MVVQSASLCKVGEPVVDAAGRKQYTCSDCGHVSPWLPAFSEGYTRVCTDPKCCDGSGGKGAVVYDGRGIYRLANQHEVSPGNSIYRCARCGWLSPPVASQEAAEELHGPCDKPEITPPPRSPNLWMKGANFLRAYAEHLAKGSQECSFQEILDRFTICSACPSKMYNDVKEECGSCGCYTNLLLASEGRNKLAWKETACPLNHWPAAM